MTVAEAQKSYEDKKATVFSLDTTDLGQYGEGIILKKGGHRFGVFSVTAPTTVRAIEKQVAYFVKYKVDFIVAITPDKATSTTLRHRHRDLDSRRGPRS
mgnify:CR=1 FL=1